MRPQTILRAYACAVAQYESAPVPWEKRRHRVDVFRAWLLRYLDTAERNHGELARLRIAFDTVLKLTCDTQDGEEKLLTLSKQLKGENDRLRALLAGLDAGLLRRAGDCRRMNDDPF